MKKHIYYALLVSSAFVVHVYCAQKKEKASDVEFTELVETALSHASSLEFDEKAKEKDVVALVEKVKKTFEEKDLGAVASALSHTKEYVVGEVYAFIMDLKGNFIAHPQSELIWKNFYNAKDALGAAFAQQMIKKAQEGGGWVTYQWRDATKNSYVQLVKKDDKQYVIGAGYYPHSKKDTVVTLVKGAAEVVKQDLQDGRPIEQAFSTISYPLGRFVVGDLYLYALRFDGTIFAHGQNPLLVGVNSIEYQDTRGKFVNKEIIEKLKATPMGEGIWIDYVSHNADKKAYAQKVADEAGNEYFVACGYYPEAGREKVVDLVQRGYQFMKAHGITQTVEAFGDGDEYEYGDLTLFVYDLKGTIIYESNEALIGQNILDAKDEDGKHYVRNIIQKAKDGGGWVDFKINKSFKSAYVEQIELGVDTFVIGSGLYPVSKKETTQLLAKSGASYLETHALEDAFEQFVEPKANFIRGDLSLFVFDMAGNCYVYGDEYDRIWENMIEAKDDDGKPYVKILINASRTGPAKVTYHLNGRPVVAFTETVQKNGTQYVIGSSFYT